MNHFKVNYISGTVVGSQKHTQSHLYSEGGGGWVGPTGGKVKAPEIKSYNTTKHEIFLKLPTNQELSVCLELDGVALREGHLITLLAVFQSDMDTGVYARLCNHTTGILYNILTVDQWRSLAYTHRLGADKSAHESQQLASPQSKSVFGVFKRLAGFLDSKGKELAQGWEAAGKFTNAGKPLTQQEMNMPLALELERVISAAVPNMTGATP